MTKTILKFNVTLKDIADESPQLGERISDDKLVKKVLRSLPKRFFMKVVAIEKARDITTMKLDELVGSLLITEMTFEQKYDKKSKGIALRSSTIEDQL